MHMKIVKSFLLLRNIFIFRFPTEICQKAMDSAVLLSPARVPNSFIKKSIVDFLLYPNYLYFFSQLILAFITSTMLLLA